MALNKTERVRKILDEALPLSDLDKKDKNLSSTTIIVFGDLNAVVNLFSPSKKCDN
jgi:hypothetical protein